MFLLENGEISKYDLNNSEKWSGYKSPHFWYTTYSINAYILRLRI